MSGSERVVRGSDGGSRPVSGGAGSSALAVVAAWLVVATPLAYGVWQTLLKAVKLFTG